MPIVFRVVLFSYLLLNVILAAHSNISSNISVIPDDKQFVTSLHISTVDWIESVPDRHQLASIITAQSQLLLHRLYGTNHKQLTININGHIITSISPQQAANPYTLCIHLLRIINMEQQKTTKSW